jgi:methionine synthase II (cobalamin-independent)
MSHDRERPIVSDRDQQREEDAALPYVATGIGSLPGTHAEEAARIVAGELPAMPHLVELPARGPGADMIGRTMSLLAHLAPDLSVETTPAGWRFADAPGRAMRRATSWLLEDCDAAEQHYRGASTVKIQVCGPWTLAAAVEMRNGHKAIRDPGACREIAMALADAVSQHVADMQRRLPGSLLIVQVDEPSLPTVLAGGVSTVSGIATYRSVDVAVATSHLHRTVEAAHDSGARTWIHCCAANPPMDVLRRSGAAGISLDLSLLTPAIVTEVGEAIDDNVLLALGVIPGTGDPGPDTASTARSWGEQSAKTVVERLHRWGFGVEEIANRIVLTPSCGLAGAHPMWVRVAYAALRESGRLIREDAGMEELIDAERSGDI